MKFQISNFKFQARRFGVGLLLLLIAALFLATWLGSEKLSFFELTDAQSAILFDIRLPRVLLGACIGASLAVAGASLQSLLRNPLAEPYLLGVSNGAALGTMLAFVFFANFEFARPICAIAGAGLATIAVYQMAKITRRNECRKTRFIGRDCHDFSFFNYRFADFFARCGKTSFVYILAARRFVAGDEKRILS